MYDIETMNRMVAERGPRFAVTATIRRGQYYLMYAPDAELAERFRQQVEDDHMYMIQVYPPEGSVDLTKLGKDVGDARRVLRDRTEILRAAVLRALEAGRAEAEVARQAGIDRMTVRDWAGKRR